VQPTTVVCVAGTAATSSVQIAMPQGWNLIGHPFSAAVPLANCQVTNGVTTQTWNAAVSAGWVGSGLFFWDQNSGYLLLTAAGYGQDNSLRPWRGYWIAGLTSGLSLIVPKP
jgi:hypothetical protein